MPLGDVRVNPQTGEFWQLTAQGWTQKDPEKIVSAAEKGSMGAFLEGMLPEALFPGADPQTMQETYPNATTAGFATGLGAALLPIPGAQARAVTMAERVAARAKGAETLAGRPGVLGGDSVGAAAAGAPRGAMAEVTGRWMDDLLAPQEMTADQVAILPVGKRLGFEELPGMRGRGDSPGRLYMASYMSHPAVRFAIQDTLDKNMSIIEAQAMKALGAPEVPFGMRGLGEAQRRLGLEFDAVRDALPETVTLPESLLEKLTAVNKVAPELELVLEGNQISPGSLMRLRSDLNKHAMDLASAQGMRLKGDRVGEVAQELYQFIAGELGPEMAQRWQVARERWMVSKLLENRGVIQPDGSISWRTVRGVLDREMPDAFRKGLEDRRARLSGETRDFMDAVNYANAFGDLVPNSGTATRMTIGKLSTVDYLRGQALRYWLRTERDRLNPIPE